MTETTDDPSGGFDVTIIGAGAIGVASALGLAEAGKRVEVLDRDPPTSGASYGNAGVISPWTCTPQSLPGLWRSVPSWLLDPEGPLSVRLGHAMKFAPWAMKFLAAGREDRLAGVADAMFALSRPSIELYRRNLEGTGAEHLIQDCSYVHVYRGAAPTIDLNATGWRLRRERDVPFRVVEGDALRDIEPALSPDYGAAVVIDGQARALDPGAVGRAIAKKAADMGVVFRQLEVKAITPESDGGWRIDTDQGTRRAPQLVLTAGAWSVRLLEPLGVRLPLEAERGYHLMLKNPGVEIRNSVMDVSGKFVASSMVEGVRCAGTAEFAGLDAPPNYKRALLFSKAAARLFPDINTDDVEPWMGARPSFPDSLPCIGPIKGLPNLTAAFGHCHYGFGMAPATGRIVSGLITGALPNIDLAPYRAERFS